MIQTTYHSQSLSGRRIIIILGCLELGGAERQAILLARHLKHVVKADVHVWGFNTPGKIAKMCQKFNIPWRIVRLNWTSHPFGLFRNLIRYAWRLRQAKPDVILPYTMFPNVLSGMVWRSVGAKLCIWNQRDGGVERAGRTVENIAVHQIPQYVSNSQQGKDFLVRSLEVEPDKVCIIQNGIELAEPFWSQTKWRNSIGLSEKHFLVCMIANLSHNKDHVTLLRAWKIVIKELEGKGQPAALILAGRFDKAFNELKHLVYNIRIERTVFFLGQVDDIQGLLNAVDLAVFSSRLEGSPNGLLESMAAGLAVVGTDILGIRDALGPEGYENLVPPGDAEAMAAKILMLYRTPWLRSKFGEMNKRRVNLEFPPQRMCEEMVKLISRGLDIKCA